MQQNVRQNVILKAAEALSSDISRDSKLVIAAYGCGDGKLDAIVLGLVLKSFVSLQNCQTLPDIKIVLNELDQQVDTATVEEYILFGLDALRPQPKLTCVVSNQTFFERLDQLEMKSVHFAYSSFAWHFLSAPIACEIPDHAYIHLSEDVSVREKWKKKATEDWKLLLGARHNELREGAVLLVRLYSADQLGLPYGADHTPALEIALQELIEEGTLKREDVMLINSNLYFRQTAEMTGSGVLAELGFECMHIVTEPYTKKEVAADAAKNREQIQVNVNAMLPRDIRDELRVKIDALITRTVELQTITRWPYTTWLVLKR